jgi:hypothetical protein
MERAMKFDDPKRWYDRAAQLRVLADDMANDEHQRMLLKLADDFYKLGDRFAERRVSLDRRMH